MKSRYSIQERFDMIMECRNSGLSDYQWCKHHDIKSSTFYGWIKQVKKHNFVIPEPADSLTYTADTKPDIVRLDVVDNPCAAYVDTSHSGAPSCAMEITLGKATIKISNDINPMLLSKVVSLLGEVLC